MTARTGCPEFSLTGNLGRDPDARKLEVARSNSSRVAGQALRKGAGAGMWGSLAESYDLAVVLKGCFTSSKLATPKINPEGDARE
jgi:hypothetical protein